LTLVSAPAGFGKTTLVAAWAQGVGLPVAWLSLEEADNDPARFLRYLVAALQRVDATLGRDMQGALESSPRLDLATGAIVNELAGRPDDFVLVLDDLHVIEDAERISAEVDERVHQDVRPGYLIHVDAAPPEQDRIETR